MQYMPRLPYYLLTAASLNNELIPVSFRQRMKPNPKRCRAVCSLRRLLAWLN